MNIEIDTEVYMRKMSTLLGLDAYCGWNVETRRFHDRNWTTRFTFWTQDEVAGKVIRISCDGFSMEDAFSTFEKRVRDFHEKVDNGSVA